MELCGAPNRTYSMMDEYTPEMEKSSCYVNPFVGEGRYARYLRLWLSVVPKRQERAERRPKRCCCGKTAGATATRELGRPRIT